MNFSQEVLDASFTTPIVVDFWAEWCGPCRVLGPVIEELAEAANGIWKLVKLNTEQEPDISKEYMIRSIPAVKMFYKGKVVAEFTGALPKYQIEQWLKENLPDNRNGKLDLLIENGHIDELKQFVAANPDMPMAAYELAIRILKTDTEQARELLKTLQSEQKFIDKTNDALALLELIELDDFSDVSDIFIRYITEAKAAYLASDFDGCLNNLIASININKAFSNELARRVCIAIFRSLGEEDELTKRYRKRFNMALY